MIDEGIREGLKHALAKGQTLKSAMFSFYNAGYKKEDIENAARDLLTHSVIHPAVSPSTATPIKSVAPSQIKSISTTIPIKNELPKPATFQSITKPVTPISNQIVSRYESEGKRPRGKIIMIILIAVALLMLGILTAIFLFREDFVEFFRTIFS